MQKMKQSKKQKNSCVVLLSILVGSLAFLFILLIQQNIRFDGQTALFSRKIARTSPQKHESRKSQDTDKDGISDTSDNCPDIANPHQADGNHNGQGDFCDSSDQDVLSSNDWAYVSYEALKKYKDLTYYWKSRVAPDSENFFNAGGGWNDDVELAASLTGYWLLTGDESVANDIFRAMADEIQKQPYVGSKGVPWVQPGDHRIEQGFTTVMLDSEHSAEETTLVFPRMTYVDYGEPRNIELMTRTIWNFQDSVSQSGYTEENWAVSVGKESMLMRSPRYNARNVDFTWVIPDPDTSIEPQDVVENFKTTLPSLSLAWYYGSSHPFWQDSGFMKQHHNTWMAATKVSIPSQGAVSAKPAKIPPSKILLTSKPDSGQWNFGDWNKNQSDPEGFDGGWMNGAYVFRHFYQALIGDWMIFNGTDKQSFAQDASDLVSEAFHYRQNAMQVSENNISLDRQFMQWRTEVASSPDDQLFLDTRKWKDSDTRMTAYNIYLERYKTSRQSSDFTNAMTLAWDAFNHIFSTLNGNFDDWTSGTVADGVTDTVKFEESDSWTMAALGGSGIYDGAYPTMYISLKQPANHIVTLVNEKSPTKISFWAYNFGDSSEELGVRFWRLSEGSGRMTLARDSNKDGQADYTLETLDVSDTGRGQETKFILPHHKMYFVTIEVTSPRTKNLNGVADPAIGRKDFRYENGKVFVDVHNIGIGQASGIFVKLFSKTNTLLGQTSLDLSGFTTLNPSLSTVTFDVTGKISSSDELGSIVLEYSGEEITKLNNTLKM
ncbi:thrombospondin type 3 repeat-containing protein [Candidatus Peregrinibacteria bacterium]|nr:thrombospondin type 3 repeat-containing protein [Candidatus Peregrinibacteria bacterium]